MAGLLVVVVAAAAAAAAAEATVAAAVAVVVVLVVVVVRVCHHFVHLFTPKFRAHFLKPDTLPLSLTVRPSLGATKNGQIEK